MKYSIVAEAVKSSNWGQKPESLFSPELNARLRAMDRKEIEERLDRIFSAPVDGSIELTWEMMDLYYVVSWAKAFELLGFHQELRVMEVASGDVTVVPRAAEAFSKGTGSYLTAKRMYDL